jgi:3-phosphoshikimate 1-carboxyvinyltransferase
MAWSSISEPLAVPCGAVARGVALLPPSKSLTHRAYALALLAAEPVTVLRPLDADDTRLFRAALEAIGCRVERAGERVRVTRPAALAPRAALDCGNAGTVFRFLVALVATLPGEWTIDGTPRLRERPVGALVEALRALGVVVECRGQEGFAPLGATGRDGFAPLAIRGGTLSGGRAPLDASESSQFLSALLLAGQRAAGPIELEVPRLVSAPYVALTVELLRAHGGFAAEVAPGRWRTEPRVLAGGEVAIEPDLSAAAYPAAAAAATGGEILLAGVSLASRQGDRRWLELVARMGATVAEERGGVRVAGGGLAALDEDFSDIPDQVPTLAALAPFAVGTTRIRNVAHLRLKESDRLAAMASELRRAGAEVDELPDGLAIPGVWSAREPPGDPVTIDPHGDHRIAMAMALVGLRRRNLAIGDPGVVAKSWPEFWRELARWTASGAAPAAARR